MTFISKSYFGIWEALFSAGISSSNLFRHLIILPRGTLFKVSASPQKCILAPFFCAKSVCGFLGLPSFLELVPTVECVMTLVAATLGEMMAELGRLQATVSEGEQKKEQVSHLHTLLLFHFIHSSVIY